MSSSVVILQLAILGVVLESDLGLRKIGWFRVARPVITVAAIAPSYLTSMPTSGNNLAFQGLGLLVGATIGALSVSPLFVSVGYEPAYRDHWHRLLRRPAKPAIVSRAGRGYAIVWIVMAAARLAFAYCAVHVFAHGLGHFLASNQLNDAGLTNALVFLSIGMDLFRSAGLVIRGVGVHRRLGGVRPSAPTLTVTTPASTAGGATVGPGSGSHVGSGAGAEALRVGAKLVEDASSIVVGRALDRTDRRRDRRRRRRDY